MGNVGLRFTYDTFCPCAAGREGQGDAAGAPFLLVPAGHRRSEKAARGRREQARAAHAAPSFGRIHKPRPRYGLLLISSRPWLRCRTFPCLRESWIRFSPNTLVPTSRTDYLTAATAHTDIRHLLYARRCDGALHRDLQRDGQGRRGAGVLLPVPPERGRVDVVIPSGIAPGAGKWHAYPRTH